MSVLIIIAAPSGSGKTTIVRRLLRECPSLSFSISATTRSPRGSEVHGKDYYFISVKEFQERINGEEFLEWEMVYEGKYYGTLKSEIDRIYAAGKYPLLDIDVVGAVHLKEIYHDKVFAIFIKAPSVEELERRLMARNTDSPEVIKERISKAEFELGLEPNFDVVVVNDVLDDATKEIKRILGERFPELL